VELSPKQREIRDREERLLDVAQAMLLERGYEDLRMDRIAEVVGVSKGTVYQHFGSRDDLVAAVAARSAATRAALFERAARFEGASRERMAAVEAAAEVFFALFPHHEQAERLVRAAHLSPKISPERVAALQTCTQRCFEVATRIAAEAAASGDLPLHEGQSVGQLCVGLWNLYQGAFLMRDLEKFMSDPAVDDAIGTLQRNARVLLDGFGWRPLSTELDYSEARERALNELFANEAQAAGLL
jgi:AcrR family transcriptional regulator